MIEVRSFPKEEQETTIATYRGDATINIYSSDSTVITKLKKITPKGNIKILTVNEAGNITSGIFTVYKNQVLYRKVPKKSKIHQIDGN